MFSIKPVETRNEALHIAEVRNSGREFMTHDPDYIAPHQQTEWFQRVYLAENLMGRMHAFVGYEGIEPVAYGMARQIDEDYWVSGVVSSEARGKGYGELLFKYLSAYTLTFLSDRVMLDVLKTNERAIGLYKKLGYTVLTEEADCLVMCLDKEAYHES